LSDRSDAFPGFWKGDFLMMHFKQITFFGLCIGLAVGCGSAPQQETTPETTSEEPAEVQVDNEGDVVDSQEGQEDRRREGFQEAIAACSNAEEAAECTFETPRGQRTGTCVKSRKDDQLICRPARPEGGRGPGRGEPPEEMLAACEGQTDGAECAFGEGDAEVKGTCAKTGDDRLVCRPEGKEGMGKRGKRGNASQMNEAKMQACAELSEGEECSFEGPKGPIAGTCKKGPKEGKLICKPEKSKMPGQKGRKMKKAKPEAQ
jgi:hypothetical protein